MDWKPWLAMLLVVAAVAPGCSRSDGKAAGGKATDVARGPADLAGLPADPKLNPRVMPPAGGITLSPDMPAVAAPPGMISQAEAVKIALKGNYDMPLVLSKAEFDKANGGWEIRFTTDGRSAMAPRSHPPQSYTSDDPVQQRKEEISWLSVAGEVHLFLDGHSGESRGGGFAGAKPDLSRSDLEHYRGRILTGGETVRLRLVNPDGSREGRDLDVDVPADVLTGGLALWQLKYGMGRVLDVWGLTGPQGRVVAYKLSLPNPPPERLLATDLVDGVPVMPDGRCCEPGPDSRRSFVVPHTSVGQVLQWYQAQMPDYGWRLQAASAGPGDAVQFADGADQLVQVSVSEAEGGVRVILTWP